MQAWTSYEDDRLREALILNKKGTKNWREVAAHVGTKTAHQCQQRWKNTLNPDVLRIKGRWTTEVRSLPRSAPPGPNPIQGVNIRHSVFVYEIAPRNQRPTVPSYSFSRRSMCFLWLLPALVCAKFTVPPPQQAPGRYSRLNLRSDDVCLLHGRSRATPVMAVGLPRVVPPSHVRDAPSSTDSDSRAGPRCTLRPTHTNQPLPQNPETLVPRAPPLAFWDLANSSILFAFHRRSRCHRIIRP